jgi:hypothetical protein
MYVINLRGIICIICVCVRVRFRFKYQKRMRCVDLCSRLIVYSADMCTVAASIGERRFASEVYRCFQFVCISQVR